MQRLFTFSGVFLFSLSVHSQSVTPTILNAGGGTYDNSSSYYRYEWSFGEATSIQTFSSSTLVVTTGVLQPGTNIPTANNSSDIFGSEEVKVFPNPVATELEIDISTVQKGKISLLLIDESGKTMGKKELDYTGIGSIQKWDMSAFASGNYFLKILLEPTPGSVAKKGAFKIVKIK